MNEASQATCPSKSKYTIYDGDHMAMCQETFGETFQIVHIEDQPLVDCTQITIDERDLLDDLNPHNDAFMNFVMVSNVEV